MTTTVYRAPQAYATQIASLRRDSYNAYTLALSFDLTGNYLFARGARAIIDAWAKRTTFPERFSTDSALPWSSFFPGMIIAADMLDTAGALPAVERQRFADFVRAAFNRMSWLPLTNDTNQGEWGLVDMLATAVFLRDSVLINLGVLRFKAIADAELSSTSVPIHEIRRQGASQGDGSSGLQYCNFYMMATTYAAVILQSQGIDVFDYVSRRGGTLRQLYEKVARWSVDPASYPYNRSTTDPRVGYWFAASYAILNSRWPLAAAQTFLDRSGVDGSVWTLHATTLLWG